MRLYRLNGTNWVRATGASPQPGPGQAVVRVRATAVNYRDWLVAGGKYAGKIKPDLIPLSDCAGEVVAIGQDVSRVAVGDRVCGTFFQTWNDGPITAEIMRNDLGGKIDGVLAEEVALREDGLVKFPPHLSFEEAATLPCAGVTAWHALMEKRPAKVGDVVLLLGTGGVSTFGLRFAKAAGCRTIVTSGSAEKAARAKALGADETIDYRATPDWDKAVWNLTNKRGVDHVLEVGGAGTLEKSLAAATYGGHVALIGVLTGAGGEIDPSLALYKSLTLQGIYVGDRSMFERMNEAITAHAIRPVVDQVFSFEQAPAALRKLGTASHVGKIVITMG